MTGGKCTSRKGGDEKKDAEKTKPSLLQLTKSTTDDQQKKGEAAAGRLKRTPQNQKRNRKKRNDGERGEEIPCAH